MANQQIVTVPQPNIVRIKTRLLGVTPLLVNPMTDAERGKMLAKQQNKQVGKEPRNPKADFESKRRKNGRADVFPAIGVLEAMASASHRFGERNTGKLILGAISIRNGPYLSIVHRETGKPLMPTMLESPTRIKNTWTLAYRPAYEPWAMDVEFAFDRNDVSEETIIWLLQHAGMKVGIGSWRKENKGLYGQFELQGA